jgi:tetratricopeptide (TPR) repeat protein
LFLFRRNRTKSFLKLIEVTPKNQVVKLISRVGYSYDQFSTLTKQQRLKLLTKKYILLAYLSTVVSITLIIIVTLLPQDSRSSANLLVEAKELLKTEKINKAYEKFIETLAITPHNLEALSGKAEDKIFLANFYRHRGRIKSHSNDWEGALKDYRLGLDTIKGHGTSKSKEILSALYRSMSAIFFRKERYNEAIQALEKAIKLSDEIDDERSKLTGLTNIAIVYREQKDYKRAIEMLKEGENIARRLNAKKDIVFIYWRYARLYENIDFEKAVNYYQKALSDMEDKDINDLRLESRILGDYGKLLCEQLKRYDEGEKKLIAALGINIQVEDFSSIGAQTATLFDLYSNLGEFKKSYTMGIVCLVFIKDVSYDLFSKYQGKLKAVKKKLDPKEIINFIQRDFIIGELSRITGIPQAKWNKILPININQQNRFLSEGR